MTFKTHLTNRSVSGILAITGGYLLSATTALAAGSGEAAGLPQLDISTWPNQLLWLAVTFTIGYLLMAKVITPRIGGVLEARRKTVSDDLKRAKEADAEAKDMKQSYESALEDARAKAAEAASKAMAEAKAQAEAAEAELAAKLAKKTKAAETRLAKMRDEAMTNIDDVAKDLTLDTVLNVTGMKVTKTDAGKALKKVSASLSGQEA